MDRNGQKWSQEETIIAFYYYCQIPFGKIHKTNPKIIQIAEMLGRTPSSVVFKMGNLGHFDPELQKRKVNGLSNASKTDAEVVEMFYGNWEELAFQAHHLESTLFTTNMTDAITTLPEGKITVTEAKARINHDFFRESVLSSYKHRCCITGLAVDPLLVASHIKPWAIADPKTERTNPSNGLCLNALHDKAFDRGLITVLPDFTIRVSSQLTSASEEKEATWLIQCNHQKITLPDRFLPNKELLQYHNDTIFIP